MQNRRSFIKASGFLMGGSLLPWHDLPKSLFALKAGTLTALRNNVGIFTERGGTIAWMIDSEAIVVVDTQFPDTAANLITEIKTRSTRQVDLLINTHHHGDHSGGNIAFAGLVQKVVAHENSKINQQNVAKARNSEASQLYPTETFSDKWSQKVGKETMTLHYFGAAHTNGDSLVHFENANVVHMGDLMFNRRYPFVDRSAGASIKSWINVLAKAQVSFDKKTLFVFGHSADNYPVTGSRKDLKAMQNFLSRLYDFVGAEIKAGKSKEQILAATAIPKVKEWKGDGIQRGLTSAYEEHTEGK